MLEYFVLEVTARSASNILEIQPNTAILFYKKLRQIISYHLALQSSDIFGGAIELDESCLEDKDDDKKGIGFIDEVVVFGILKRDDKIYTIAPKDLTPASLPPLESCKIVPDSIIYSNTHEGNNALDMGSFQYQQIIHSAHLPQSKTHQNAIQNFWVQTKRVLRKYNGINKNSFALFLKECEFRFNYGTPKQQYEILRLWCDV